MEPYACDLPGSEPQLAELVLLRRADEQIDARTVKEVFAESMMRVRSESDLIGGLRRRP